MRYIMKLIEMWVENFDKYDRIIDKVLAKIEEEVDKK